jgi:hypothetical protein
VRVKFQSFFQDQPRRTHSRLRVSFQPLSDSPIMSHWQDSRSLAHRDPIVRLRNVIRVLSRYRFTGLSLPHLRSGPTRTRHRSPPRGEWMIAANDHSRCSTSEATREDQFISTTRLPLPPSPPSQPQPSSSSSISEVCDSWTSKFKLQAHDVLYADSTPCRRS